MGSICRTQFLQWAFFATRIAASELVLGRLLLHGFTKAAAMPWHFALQLPQQPVACLDMPTRAAALSLQSKTAGLREAFFGLSASND